jgi:hypothetical protein
MNNPVNSFLIISFCLEARNFVRLQGAREAKSGALEQFDKKTVSSEFYLPVAAEEECLSATPAGCISVNETKNFQLI